MLNNCDLTFQKSMKETRSMVTDENFESPEMLLARMATFSSGVLTAQWL